MSLMSRAVFFISPVSLPKSNRQSPNLTSRHPPTSLQPPWPRARSTLPEKQTPRPQKNSPKPELSRVNRLLASRRLSATVLVISSITYVTTIILIARALACATGPQRVLLLGLGILLPDFRHILRTYADAVRALKGYRPFTIRFPTRKEAVVAEKVETDWVRVGVQRMREVVNPEVVEKFDELVSSWSRDVTRPIVETGTQIQQMTTGTDITLRKNVVVAAVSIGLSLAGYVACVVGEAYVGGVAIMLAVLLHTALLARSRHEMLALVNDVRVVISLVGVLSCVLSVMLPTAVYVFLLCCVALVVMRFPLEMTIGL